MKKYKELLVEAKLYLSKNRFNEALALIKKAKIISPGINELDELLYEIITKKFVLKTKSTIFNKIYSYILFLISFFIIRKKRFKLYEKIWINNPVNILFIKNFIDICINKNKTKHAIYVLNFTFPITNFLRWHNDLISRLFKNNEIQDELDFRLEIQKKYSQNKENDEIINNIQKKISTQKIISYESLVSNVKNSPENEKFHIELINFLINKRKFNDAIEHLEKYSYLDNIRLKKRLLQIKIHDINLKLAKAEDDDNDIDLVKKLKKESEMIRIDKYKLNIKENPSDQQLKYEFSKLLLDLKMYHESIDQFKKIILYKKRRIRILIYLSTAYEKIRDYDNALSSLELALNETEIPNEKNDILKNITNLKKYSNH